ncbi:class I SAM-dependent RNA methyltransferase [Carboxylicivirga sp. M1479]|uniref:THUMP domain-containing class I SAM-dependent RNA methyltransferase n=1 Tax=Carboxylicivirga sp. M1479 TaxID=2594476 RepID=UPI0011782BDC|nr:THUMP domain-containing protein [Carboxylicivirga sp. M1479]TRX66520.1 methyltransferase [Carboxylicivirga sp. M1479]
MKLLIKTFHGLEEVLAEELREIGAKDVTPIKRAVTCSGDKELMYKANLHLRTALRVLVPIFTFKAENEDELYKNIYDYDWSAYINEDSTFAIDAVAFSDFFKHSKFLALKSKDAIVDQFREKSGKRPSINIEKPDLQINIHVSHDQFTVSLDSSVESLHRRGYRDPNHKAPLNEALAAGMLKIAKWHKDIPLLDPMCGTGTILMEAAMMACDMPANYKRKHFGFMSWGDFDKALWEKVYSEAESKIRYPKVNIVGGDNNAQAVDMAKTASLDFRLNRQIRIVRSNMEDHMPTAPRGMMITNPPYGERLTKDNIDEFYKKIGTHLKRNYTDWQAWIITSNFDALKQVGLRPDSKYTLYNGPLECKYVAYDMFEGEMKAFKKKINRTKKRLDS